MSLKLKQQLNINNKRKPAVTHKLDKLYPDCGNWYKTEVDTII